MKKLKPWLRRVLPDVRRNIPQPDACLEELLSRCERLHAQEKTDKKKLYSLHESTVMCISHGKAHKRYEFGQQVSVTNGTAVWYPRVYVMQRLSVPFEVGAWVSA